VDLQLEGKRAVVAGASRGIGKAIARRLALEGCDVAIGARSEGPLNATAAELAKETGRKVIGVPVDTLEIESVRRFISRSAEQLGGIEILINCAARVGGARGDVETVSFDDVLHDFNEKVVGALRCAQEAVPHMKKAGWGRIVNISGSAARSPGTQVSGGARNSAMITVTKALANALGPHGINVTAVYPGQTITEASMERYAEQSQREGRSVESIMQEQAERTLIKHLVTADDIASVAVFLCSPLAIGITGEAIAVNGGTSTEVHH
jgi:NAD(P)-dependent dehydrogenase (short-subunit alcohol dehydrogenase family)